MHESQLNYCAISLGCEVSGFKKSSRANAGSLPNCNEGFAYSKNNHFDKGQWCWHLQRSETRQVTDSDESPGIRKFWGPPQPASLHLWQMNGLPGVSMWFSPGSLPQRPLQGQLDLTCRTQSCVLNKCSPLSTWAMPYNVLCISPLYSLTQYQRLRYQLGEKQASKSGSTIDRGFFWSGHGNVVPTSSLDQNIRSPELYFQFSPWGLLVLFTASCTSTFFICKMDTAPPAPLHRHSQETV